MKIGYTARRVSVRLAEGQTFAPEALLVLAESPGTLSDESRLHRIFREDHSRGEWYRYTPRLKELVGYLADGGSLESWLSVLDE